MEQSLQTAQDIFHRNNHTDPFKIKIPSHHASQHNINVMTQAYILNKLALLPFYQSQKLTQLYKMALDFLINQIKDKFKNEEYVDGVASHLENWQVNMSMFGVWPYTRACFYLIQQKLKQNQVLLQKVILKRGILQPNKQQFINKSRNMNFQSQNLKLLVKICNKQSQPSLQESFQLPQDILYLDSDQCWIELKNLFQNQNLTKQNIEDYLIEYERKGLPRYLSKNLKKDNIQAVLEGVQLRSNIYSMILESKSQHFAKVINILQAKL